MLTECEKYGRIPIQAHVVLAKFVKAGFNGRDEPGETSLFKFVFPGCLKLLYDGQNAPKCWLLFRCKEMSDTT